VEPKKSTETGRMRQLPLFSSDQNWRSQKKKTKTNGKSYDNGLRMFTPKKKYATKQLKEANHKQGSNVNEEGWLKHQSR
jgi:hypothetical protein